MQVENKLLAEPVRHLDLYDYCTITPSTTVREAVAQMRETNTHTAFIVGEHTRLQGILTDRDVMTKICRLASEWDKPVSELMTREVTTISPDATAAEALRIMDEKGFRNVPVISTNGTPIGNVTYVSLVNYLGDHFKEVALNRPPMPGYVSRRDGG